MGKKAGLYSNLLSNDIPKEVLDYIHLDYNEFLKMRRRLMANRIKEYFESL